MKTVQSKTNGFREILIEREATLLRALRKPEGLAIEKSADPMDEIQSASERDLQIRNADQESTLLRDVRAALQRIDDGSFGVCVDCEERISARRLQVVPWAARCVHCQDVDDRNKSGDLERDLLVATA